jgi:hypothetical protein
MPRVTGGREAAADLMALAKKSPRAMERALYKYGNVEMTEAKRLTPVEFGTLRDSGVVDEPEWQGNTLSMELGFGGAAEDYALYVHEDMEAFHKHGQAKFLEIPLNQSEPYFEDRVGADFVKFAGIK